MSYVGGGLSDNYIGPKPAGGAAASGGGGGGATGGGTDAVFYENDQTITTSYTLEADKNAMTTGPVTINEGVSVTIETGARWVVI